MNGNIFRSIRSAVLWAAFLFSVAGASAGGKLPPEKYRSSGLPAGISCDARAVIRYDAVSFEVKDTKKATERVHRVITVLNAEGRDFGEMVMPYDKYLKINDLEGHIYDADGKEVRSLESKDIKDYPMISDYSLYEDTRTKHVSLYYSSYPYTVEFEFAYSYEGYISWPSWFPEEKDAAVENSKFEVAIPKEWNLRYWKNIVIEPVIDSSGDAKLYRWEASHLPAFELEQLGPDISVQKKGVRIAPGKFELDGYAGDLSTWNSFGEWFGKLSAGRQVLPPEAQAEVGKLTAGITDRKEIIRKLYEFLQTSTRYVNIRLGIGGWQPFDAAYVYQRKYGDCKALTNYMMSLLKAANIVSYPVLINHGNAPDSIKNDFPENLFNHVILCVPSQPDTTWLECTNDIIACGRIGSGNENRLALVVGPQGGTLVRTPRSIASDNCQVRHAVVTVSVSGDATAGVTTEYTGDQQDHVDWLKTATPKERDEWLHEDVEIPVYKIKNADYSSLGVRGANSRLSLDMDIAQFANRAGSGLLFQPNLMERRSFVPEKTHKRKSPIVHAYPYLDIDSVKIILPAGFGVQASPKPVSVETEFGKYASATQSLPDGSLMYVRKFELSSTEIPAAMFGAYRTFLEQVTKADNASLMIHRK
jgi:hypothetical protein